MHTTKKQQTEVCCSLKFGESAGARTRDPNIKSVVLYLLSYGFIVPNRNISVFGGANVGNIFIIAKFILLLLRFSQPQYTICVYTYLKEFNITICIK